MGEKVKPANPMLVKVQRIKDTAVFVAGEIPSLLEGDPDIGVKLKKVLLHLKKATAEFKKEVDEKVKELKEGKSGKKKKKGKKAKKEDKKGKDKKKKKKKKKKKVF